MKKVLLLISLCFCIGQIAAQDADKLRNEGDAAYNAKNYAEALTKYSEFLKLTNYEDEARVFTAGLCADQVDKYDEAVKFFDMAIAKNYQTENAYVGKAKALREAEKTEEFAQAVEDGLKAFPSNTNLASMCYSYFMKLGQAEQKNKDIDNAVKYYSYVTKLSNNKYKGNALYSLGSIYYSKGVDILKAAQATPATYEAEKTKADAEFKKAKDYLDQAVAAVPDNASAQKLVDSINDLLK